MTRGSLPRPSDPLLQRNQRIGMASYTAVVTGATGATGREFVRLLLKSPRCAPPLGDRMCDGRAEHLVHPLDGHLDADEKA